MKTEKYLKIIAFAFLLFVVSCGPNSQQAVDYNDAVVAQQKLIVKELNVLEEAFVNFNPADMDRAYSSASKQIDKSLDQVNKIAPFNDNSDLKEAAIKLFGVYKSVIKNEYAAIIALNKLPESRFGKAEEIKIKDISKTIDTKLNNALAEFSKQQAAFASKYNFELEQFEAKK